MVPSCRHHGSTSHWWIPAFLSVVTPIFTNRAHYLSSLPIMVFRANSILFWTSRLFGSKWRVDHPVTNVLGLDVLHDHKSFYMYHMCTNHHKNHMDPSRWFSWLTSISFSKSHVQQHTCFSWMIDLNT